ncbi:hypothetical protein ERO13_A06G032644v2 [Gossypium hirsutum]|uniref:Serine/threonine-protein kinase-like protein At1g28390 n=1 Tax=Gossypium hirsutum TaxID=3635 RepID=A0ABM3BUY2_GOSHI|nr:serine/threonine-protein kinase-like protein At1g28390 [Gossypium hirsutum]KAG4194081.1 hypothetical protein ERO13_A06G032644v2 [Gossypium hirsutum]
MGYLSCNEESTIKVCDPCNWDYYRKKPKRNKPRRTRNDAGIRQFLYTDLLTATNGFSSDSFLGKGSHGSVYKAVLEDGKLITAVKKTSKNCNSPADNEIEILSRVYHPRLVNLIGYCSDSLCKNKLIVVEYMPNGSLYDLLHSSSCKPPGWSSRVRFALQVAKAVQTLHSGNPPVIHRDIKSSNVLIDQRWNARLGDFGLALIGHVEDVRIKCTPPAGTLGYLDPSYLAPSDVSTKSDVFSYGILLLEIISGRHAIDLKYSPPSVVDWAVPLIKGGDFAAICDGRVGPPVGEEVIRSLAVLAARCVRSAAEKRPGMEEVVECLTVVSKRVHAGPVWSNLRRCVRCVHKPMAINHPVFEGSEEAARSSRCGSRRNSRKVTSVADRGCEANVIGEGVVRSKSIGSLTEAVAASMMKVGPTEIDMDGEHVALVRKRPAKTPTVKLSKSRSMGVLQSPRLMNLNGKQYVFEIGKRRNSSEFDISKLVINFDDDKSQRKILEKPLVFV